MRYIRKELVVVLISLIAVCLQAGDPIQFSHPRKKVNTPKEDPLEALLNKPFESLKPDASLGPVMVHSLPMPPPTIIIKKDDTDEQKKLFDQNQNGLDDNNLNQTLIKFPYNKNNFSRRNTSYVEQYLLEQERRNVLLRQQQQEGQGILNTRVQNPGINTGVNYNINQDVGLQNRDNLRGLDMSKLDGLTTKRQNLNYREDNISRKLYEENSFSWNKVVGNAADFREQWRKERMDEFKRILGNVPQPQQIPQGKDPLNLSQDITRRPENPITSPTLDSFTKQDQKMQNFPFDTSSFKNRSAKGLPGFNDFTGYQNNLQRPDQSQLLEREKEKEKPQPIIKPLPRRQF